MVQKAFYLPIIIKSYNKQRKCNKLLIKVDSSHLFRTIKKTSLSFGSIRFSYAFTKTDQIFFPAI
jgi:hypothetical protein